MIMNLTQHFATPDQIDAGVIDLPIITRIALQELLTFDELPTTEVIIDRAERIAELAALNQHLLSADQAMIGGALWLMSPLASILRNMNISPVFAFSVRSTEEQIQPDGSVVKKNVFRHGGFVEAV